MAHSFVQTTFVFYYASLKQTKKKQEKDTSLIILFAIKIFVCLYQFPKVLNFYFTNPLQLYLLTWGFS